MFTAEGALVSCIVPTFNGEELLRECLPGCLEVIAASPLPVEVLVVDNGSTDGSVAWLSSLPHPVRVISLADNQGFAIACNRGAAEAKGRHLFFLNNDIRVSGEFLSPLVTLMEGNPTCFAVGPRLMRWDEVTLDDACRNPLYREGLVEAKLQEQDLERVQPMVFFCAGAVLIKRERFEILGGFDTLYTPFAWEDLDLGYRAVKRGWVNLYCPLVTVYHKREATSRRLFKESQFRRLVWRNHFLFVWGCFTSRRLLFHHLCWLPVKLLKFLFSGRSAHVVGFFAALRFLPRLGRKRRKERFFAVVTDENILNGQWRKTVPYDTY